MLAKLRQLVPSGGEPYCEPYCGGASLFFDRHPAPVEVLNDMNGDLVNLFRVIRDDRLCAELERMIQWTLYSREEFGRAIEHLKGDWPSDAPDVMRAWAFYVMHNQGFSGGRQKNSSNWSRAFTSCKGMSDATSKWIARQRLFGAWHDRLMRVQIDRRDAIETIKYWDAPGAVFYVDPPYHMDTRKWGEYEVEADHDHHVDLVQTLLGVAGSVTLSCYMHEVYQPLVDAGWARIDFETASYASARTRLSNLRGNGAAMKHVSRVETALLNPLAARLTGAGAAQLDMLHA